MSHDTFSALLDGECSAEELNAMLDAFEQSAEARAKWSRMCAVREVLHGGQPQVKVDVVANVMAAIAGESLAETAAVATPSPSRHDKVVMLRPRRSATGWRQPLVGLAAAASVAGAVAIGVNSLLSHPVEGGTSGNVVALARTPAGGALTPVVARADNDTQETGWGQLDAESARQLSGYMLEHSNYRAEQGMGGSLSYARMAVRPVDYRPATPAAGAR